MGRSWSCEVQWAVRMGGRSSEECFSRLRMGVGPWRQVMKLDLEVRAFVSGQAPCQRRPSVIQVAGAVKSDFQDCG